MTSDSTEVIAPVYLARPELLGNKVLRKIYLLPLIWEILNFLAWLDYLAGNYLALNVGNLI